MSEFFLSVPSAIVKPAEKLLDEEVAAYPGERQDSIYLAPLSEAVHEAGFEKVLERAFGQAEVRAGRRQQKSDAGKMSLRFEQLKANFPPERDGKYRRRQAPQFACRRTFQWLVGSHPDFAARFSQPGVEFQDRVFKSLQLGGLVLFYRYYLGAREIRKPSEFGDLFHLSYLPYCQHVVVERDLCETLRQIRKHDLELLGGTEVSNVDFLRQL